MATPAPPPPTDFLDQDPALRSQNYFCVSFISPEDVILKKDVFMLNRFFSTIASDLEVFFVNTKDKFKDDAATIEILESIRERYDYLFDAAKLQGEFDFFRRENNEALEKEYHEKNSFQTTIRGLKVRGTYDTLAEAKNRAEQIKKFDPHFHVFVGQVGCWCPWSPYPDDIQEQEYTEAQLNTLMQKYKEGQQIKTDLYEQRKQDKIGDKNTAGSSTVAA